MLNQFKFYLIVGALSAFLVAAIWGANKFYAMGKADCQNKAVVKEIKSIGTRNEKEAEIITLPNHELDSRLLQWCRDCE